MSRNQTCALALAGAALVAAGALWPRKKAEAPGAHPPAQSPPAAVTAPARPPGAASVARPLVDPNIERSPAAQFPGPLPPLFSPQQKRLSNEFIAAFHLTPAEASSVQGAFDVAYAGLEQRAIAHATASRPAADSLLLRVAPFDGTAVLDELFSMLKRTFGGERYRSFIRGYNFDIDAAFHFFGGETRIIEIKRTPQGSYVVTEERTTPEHLIDGEPVTFPTRAGVEGAIGRLVSLLPPDF